MTSAKSSTVLVSGVCGTILLVLLLTLHGSIVAAAVTTFGFEGFPDDTILKTQYPGVTFANAIILTAGISLNEFEFPPHSGTNVVSDDGGPITISFSPPVLSFGGYFTYSTPLTIRAFDSSNNQIAIANSRFSDNEALSGATGSSPDEFIQLSYGGGIASLTIAGAPTGESFTIDDVSVTSLSAPSMTPAPPTLILLLVGLSLWPFIPRLRNEINSVRGVAVAILLFLPLGFLLIRLSAQESSSADQRSRASRVVQRFAAQPSVIPLRATTRVLVTVQVKNPPTISGTINLIRSGPSGARTVIGTLNDNGTDGDLIAGDGVYSTQIVFNESDVRPVQLQLSVGIRGSLRRVFSDTITVTVAP